MWFANLTIFVIIIVLLYFLYETIRKWISPTEEEISENSATSEQLQQKIQELKNLKFDLQLLHQEVGITEQLKDIEKEIEKYKKLLDELEAEDK